MNANLYFWFYAYVLMSVVLVIAFIGIGKARKGQYISHMKHMTWVVNLLLFFVVSYLAKVIFLGREVKLDWSMTDLVILRIHESFIGLMLIFGGWARILAGKIKHTLEDHTPTPEEMRLRQRHRKMGKWAVITAVCAIITATMVLWGMWHRSG